MISMLVEKTVGQLPWDAVTSNLVDCETIVSPDGCAMYGEWATASYTSSSGHPVIIWFSTR